jgi:membrane-associated phospholipid phosphatase
MESSTVAARSASALTWAREHPVLRPLLRWGGPAAYLLALAAVITSEGLPTSRDAVFVWILLGLLAASLTNVRRWFRGVLFDWLPFGVILFTYDLLRGAADSLFTAHVEPQLRADELLFGGRVPTVWLQEHLWNGPARIDWVDYAAWAVYLTHFFGTLVVAAALWLCASRLFRRYVAMVSVLAVTGFATYALFPAVPPWMASARGELEPTERIARVVSRDIPIGRFGALWEHGERYANDVAAVPSLHAAYAMLIALFFWRLARWRWRVLLAAYAVAMGLALVYTAEHYVSDVLAGWLYAAFAFVLVQAIVRRRAEAGG